VRIPSDFRRGRAFQIPRPFGGMTVLENVIVGTVCSARLPRKNPYKQCVEILELCGLVDLANRRAESLGLLHRKRLELARSLATQPRVLLLDKIGSGLPTPKPQNWSTNLSHAMVCCRPSAKSRSRWRRASTVRRLCRFVVVKEASLMPKGQLTTVQAKEIVL
jgi:ABC-type Na+ transport system ATPase subunit NatA